MTNRLFIGLLAAALFAQSAVAGELDGTQWELDEKGARFWSSDTLTFSNDRFHSRAGEKDGFASAPYNTDKDDGRVSWDAQQTNPQGERLQWNGVTIGDRMDGSTTRTKAGGQTETRQWKAQLKTPNY